MSIEGQDANVQLKHDFMSFLKGEVPSLLELERAPVLENWRTLIMYVERGEDHLGMLLVLTGRVTGHPQHPDGTTIRTSQLVWLDLNRSWARSWNRVYRLGERGNDEADTT
jgi:hypothetical protein